MYPQGVCRIRRSAHAGDGCGIFPLSELHGRGKGSAHSRRRFIQRLLKTAADHRLGYTPGGYDGNKHWRGVHYEKKTDSRACGCGGYDAASRRLRRSTGRQ